MPGIIKVQHQGNNPAPQNIPTVDAQTAKAWWDNLCNLALTTPKGPARDLTKPSGLSHLLIINDAENNDFYLSAVNMNPDPQQLYTLAQQGRLLLTPTGTHGGSYQVQVNPDTPEKSMLQGINDRFLEQSFVDPRQGAGYWLMRFFNFITVGTLFSRQLNAMDQEAAASVAMTAAIKESFLSQAQAAAEWEDPAHLSSLRLAGYIKSPAQNLEDKTLEAKNAAQQRTTALLEFADNVYELFSVGEYPKPLQQTRVSDRTNGKFYEMTGSMKDVSADDMALLAFLTMADPTLDYYKTAHVADYDTLNGSLRGNDLIDNRMDQFYAGMLGDKTGALDAVYVVSAQAAKKIDNICNNPRAGVQDFAEPIIHGLNRLQNTLQTATEVNDRFLQAASLAGHVVNFLRSKPPLYESLKKMGFRLNDKLFDQVDNFYQMQVKATKAEMDIRAHALDFPHNEVPEEILESSLPIIAEARFQAMNIKDNGLQAVLPLYSDPRTSGNICESIRKNPAFEAMHGCTYRQLDGILNNSAGMFKMCSNALQGPENKPQVQSNESKLEMNAPKQDNLLAPF